MLDECTCPSKARYICISDGVGDHVPYRSTLYCSRALQYRYAVRVHCTVIGEVAAEMAGRRVQQVEDRALGPQGSRCGCAAERLPARYGRCSPIGAIQR